MNARIAKFNNDLISWAPKNARRKGWTHIYIEPSSAADLRESMDSLNNSMQVVEDSDSDDDILMQSAQNESELFGEEKSLDSTSDVDLQTLLDTPSNEKSSARENNNNSDGDDVAIVSHVNRPEIIIEDEDDDADVTDVKMHDVKSNVVADDEEEDGEESDHETRENNAATNSDNDNEENKDDEDQLVLDDSGSANDDDLEDFWNALTND